MRDRPRSSTTVGAAILVAAYLAAACSNNESARESAGATKPEAAAPAAGHATVMGKVPPAGGFSAIVVLEPQAPRTSPAPMPPRTMDQIGYAFVPGLLVVQAGQPTRFHNSEDVLHNVRVTETATQGPVFNVATVLEGTYDHTFERPGFYTVSCDVHQDMRADILVTSTPYAVIAGKDGTFTFPEVPAGPYALTVHLGGRRLDRAVEIAAPRTELMIDQAELLAPAGR